MRCPTLNDLPAPPPGKTGWPWTEETPQLPDTMPDGSPWPKISIVTPSYNQAQYIEETIRAILLQGYPNLEYIISEDASTDNSLEIIRKYAPWITLLEGEQNQGMSAAINRGFQVASGEIITWISSDDVYFPRTFEKVALRYDNDEAYGVIVGAFRFMDEASNVESEVHPPQVPDEGPIDLSLSLDWRLHQVATFYTRQALDRVGRFVREEIRHNMDRELLYRVCMDHKVGTTDEVFSAFRIHKKSKSWSVSNMVEMAHDYAKVQDYFMNEDASENAVRRQIAQKLIAKGYLRYAKYSPNVVKAVGALPKALYHRPELAKNRRFWVTCLKALRIKGVAKSIRNTLQRA